MLRLTENVMPVVHSKPFLFMLTVLSVNSKPLFSIAPVLTHGEEITPLTYVGNAACMSRLSVFLRYVSNMNSILLLKNVRSRPAFHEFVCSHLSFELAKLLG